VVYEDEAPRISRNAAHEGGKVVSPTHWPPLPAREVSLVDPKVVVRPKGLSQKCQ
jgi:hypothetical protein